MVDRKLVYWRRDLPPLADHADSSGRHLVEAQSPPVAWSSGDGAELWEQSLEPLMREADRRIGQEVLRLGADCAHVIDEEIVEKVDHATSTYKLVGRFTFVLFLPPEGTEPGIPADGGAADGR